jgi:hypothetical protein
MHLRNVFLTAICLFVPLSLSAGEAGKLREIDVKGVKVDFEKGLVSKPKVIVSADDLAKAIPEADAIKKQVDFTKEKLLLFAWGGSGGDKLTAKLSDDGKTAVFTFKAGLTRDFRRHVLLFVLPKNAEFKLEGVPGGR